MSKKQPIHELDDIDRKLIVALQADAKMTVGELADRIGLSPSPCARRVRILEDSKVIKGYAAIVDQNKVGLPISAFASVKLERQREDALDRFGKAVERWPEVVDCYLMTGHHDYLLRIVVSDLEAYEAFLRDKLTRLSDVASIETGFSLKQIKRSDVFPL
jgi:Lrp/AsnC family transcriptional regulator, leucine-responsive regulatory protein